MSPFGIRVSILEPSSFKTGLTTPDLHVRQMNGLWSLLDEDLKSDYGEEYLQKGQCVLILMGKGSGSFGLWIWLDEELNISKNVKVFL